VVANVVVGSDDVLLLGDEKLLDGERERLLEGIGVGLLGYVFTLLGDGEDFVVALDNAELDVAPGAMKGTGKGAGLFHVVNTRVVKFALEVAAEASALERFGYEELLEMRVLKMLGEIGEALLAIFEGVDDVLEDLDYFFVVDRFSHNVFPSEL
jgi:hypothetical protein